MRSSKEVKKYFLTILQLKYFLQDLKTFFANQQKNFVQFLRGLFTIFLTFYIFVGILYKVAEK